MNERKIYKEFLKRKEAVTMANELDLSVDKFYRLIHRQEAVRMAVREVLDIFMTNTCEDAKKEVYKRFIK